MTVSIYTEFMKQFVVGLGADAAPDPDGYLGLVFDDHPVHFQYDEERDDVVVFTRIGVIEELRAEEIALTLLGANLLWQGTKGATIGAEPESGAVVMADRRTLASFRAGMGESDPAIAMNSWATAFLNLAGYWRGRLDRVNAGEALDDGVDDENESSAPASYDRFITNSIRG